MIHIRQYNENKVKFLHYVLFLGGGSQLVIAGRA